MAVFPGSRVIDFVAALAAASDETGFARAVEAAKIASTEKDPVHDALVSAATKAVEMARVAQWADCVSSFVPNIVDAVRLDDVMAQFITPRAWLLFAEPNAALDAWLQKLVTPEMADAIVATGNAIGGSADATSWCRAVRGLIQESSRADTTLLRRRNLFHNSRVIRVIVACAAHATNAESVTEWLNLVSDLFDDQVNGWYVTGPLMEAEGGALIEALSGVSNVVAADTVSAWLRALLVIDMYPSVTELVRSEGIVTALHRVSECATTPAAMLQWLKALKRLASRGQRRVVSIDTIEPLCRMGEDADARIAPVWCEAFVLVAAPSSDAEDTEMRRIAVRAPRVVSMLNGMRGRISSDSGIAAWQRATSAVV